MVDEAAKSGRKLMVCRVQLLYEPCRSARELIEAGELGRILSFRTFLGVKGGAAKPDANTPPWKNAVAELGTHRIDTNIVLVEKTVNSCLKRRWSPIAEIIHWIMG